jgi:hypothetical protein
MLIAVFAITIPIQLQGQTDEAVPVEYSIRTPIARRYLMVSPRTEYYVSLEGNDRNPGTKEKPFRHIQTCADIMTPGDICYVREGTYRENVRAKSSGQRRYPITYVAYPGEKVTLSGTEPVAGEWSVYKGSIYQTKVDMDFDQLFVDGELMIEARWPNMRFDQLWERSCWATAGLGSRYGKLVDPELAETDIDWTGALATMNLAHQFLTWTRTVNTHSKGSDTYEYNRDLEPRIQNQATRTRIWEDDYYYLTGKLEALDMPTEWFLNTETGTLYLWAPDGKNPATRTIEAKVRDFAFEANNVDEIRLIGFHFFAATFQFENTVHSIVDDCHLLFPTFARELTDLFATPVPLTTTSMSGSHNTIRNTTLGYTPLSGLAMTGPENTLENNLVHDVCWNGSLSYPAISMRSGDTPGSEWTPTLIKGNTVYNIGSAGIGFRTQAYLIEYNYVHHAGLMSHDVAAIYTGGRGISGSTVCYNWVHNCHPEIENGKNIGLGIRADDQSRNMSVHHNVVWDVGLDCIIMKGEYHKVYNNTVLHTKPEFEYANSIRLDTEPEPYKAWRLDAPLLSEQNAHTLIFNNVVGLIRAEYRKATPFIHRSNAVHNSWDYAPELQDPANFDFRPKDGSELIDGGISMPGLTDSFEGNAPDIGAYESGGINWRPGYLPKTALYYRQYTSARND